MSSGNRPTAKILSSISSCLLGKRSLIFEDSVGDVYEFSHHSDEGLFLLKALCTFLAVVGFEGWIVLAGGECCQVQSPADSPVALF